MGKKKATQKESDTAEEAKEVLEKKSQKAAEFRNASSDDTSFDETKAENAPAGKQPEEIDWEKRCAELEAETQELKEMSLRKQADFENYRRRMQKDKEEAIQFANRSLISELLEVLDNFERALTSHEDEKESNPAMKTLFEGLELVEKQLGDMLSSRWGLKAIESVGQEFDPNLHEALMMEESSEYEMPTVIENFQTGYTLHNRVLRPARVKVAKPSD